MAASQARELEAFWEDGALVLRAPVRAFRRRGLIGVTLSPLLLGLLVPTVLWFGEPDDVEVLVLLALFGLTLLATTIAGIFLLTFAPALSARTRWVLRRTEAPDGSLQFLVSGRGGAVNFRVDSGSRGGAEQNGFPPSYRLVLYDPRGQQTCVLARRVHEPFRAELDSALHEVNRLLGQSAVGHAGAAMHSATKNAAPVREAEGATTPGERSLAMLCYLPVQGIFLIASLGCLVASRSRYVRSAAKQSLLQFVFSLCVLGLVLVVLGVPTALLDDASPLKLVLAAVLALGLVGYLVWNLSAHIYACFRFYQGRPWVMPWLRPVARRWFE